ncbi:MAG TPA: ATP12 family protein [Hyphomicrobiaceae bacterium]|nr:ATP12 family protein [Hyphomicrobiaceae bacterium]
MFRVLLDGRPVRTPAKALVVLPTERLARAVAAEWEAQGDEIKPASMPLVRLVNSALDGVRGREAEVAADIAKYAASDLVCYRAESPAELVQRQVAHWDPLLDWAAEALGCRLARTTGLMPVTQAEAAIKAVLAAIDAKDIYRLAALHVATTLLGSAILGLALMRRRISGDAAWTAAHVDEDWQAEQWGHDGEAEERRAARRRDLGAAVTIIELA